MRKKIFKSIAITAMLFVTITYFLCTLVLYNEISSNIHNSLKKEANQLAQEYNKSPSTFMDTNIITNARITLINQDGSVQYDSTIQNIVLTNHADRPEFIEAQKNGISESIRHSETLNKTTYYVAVRLSDNRVLRLSTIANSALSLMLSSLFPMIVILIIVYVVCLLVANYLTAKIVDPINHLNLDLPLHNETYSELEPLLENMNYHNQLRREFSANVSHELKTPLTSISGYAEIMANNLQGDNTQEFSQKIVDESKHLLHTIEDIIKISKLDEGAIQLDFETVNYQDVLREVLISLEDYASRCEVSIFDNSSPAIGRAVPQIIYEIFYNLIQNAIKYNNQHGHVWIDIVQHDKTIEIIVKDDGVGISSSDKDRVFERFFRGDKSHNSAIEGSGLGLAIVKHGVEFHQGTITLEDYLNQGSKFIINLKR